MPEYTYLIVAVVVSGLITLALRALPFAILKRLFANEGVNVAAG